MSTPADRDRDAIPEASVERHDAGVAEKTHEPEQAYAGYGEDVPVRYREGWLRG